MYNYCDGTVHFKRRKCSTSPAVGVQLERYIHCMVLFPWCFLIRFYAFYYEGFDFIGNDIILPAAAGLSFLELSRNVQSENTQNLG